MKKQTGFTLIEILIALLIFAILGVLTAVGLRQTIENNNALKIQNKSLQQLQLAMTLIRRDLIQVINRPVINANNRQESAFIGSSDALSFTRTGLFNPFDVSHRTDMQRVGYLLDGNKLIRLTWQVLDQPPGAKPLRQTLLTGITDLKWSFVDMRNKTVDSWPGGSSDGQSTIPKAVLLRMQVKGEGEIDGVFPITFMGVQQNNAN